MADKILQAREKAREADKAGNDEDTRDKKKARRSVLSLKHRNLDRSLLTFALQLVTLVLGRRVIFVWFELGFRFRFRLELWFRLFSILPFIFAFSRKGFSSTTP